MVTLTSWINLSMNLTENLKKFKGIHHYALLWTSNEFQKEIYFIFHKSRLLTCNSKFVIGKLLTRYFEVLVKQWKVKITFLIFLETEGQTIFCLNFMKYLHDVIRH